MLVWHVFRRISRALLILIKPEKNKHVGKWASAVVSHMATYEHADEGKQDINHWPFTDVRQATRAAIGAFIMADWPSHFITRHETDACKCLLKPCPKQCWHMQH